jgi:hypothetical protein
MIIFQTLSNRLCHLIASLLASIVIDRGFDPWSGQSKDYKTGIWCDSAMHAVIYMLVHMISEGLAGSIS